MRKTAFSMCVILILCVACITAVTGVKASKWQSVSISVDKGRYFQGETVEITVKPGATTTGDTSTIEIVIVDPRSVEVKRIEKVSAANPPVKASFVIPTDAVIGGYNIDVYETGNIWPLLEEKDPWKYFTVCPLVAIYPELNFDRESYLSDQEIHLAVNVIQSGKITATPPFTCDYNIVYETGYKTETNLGVSYTFDIPREFAGEITFSVKVKDSAKPPHEGTASADVHVFHGIVLLYVDRTEYKASDTVTYTYSLVTQTMTSPSYYYEIVDPQGNLVTNSGNATRTTDGGVIKFSIPANPAEYYECTVFAVQGSLKAEGFIRISRSDAYLLILEVKTSSKYVTCSYAPGDRITVHYEITSTGNLKLPQCFDIMYGLSELSPHVLSTQKASGDLVYTIPKDASDGQDSFMIIATSTDFYNSSFFVISSELVYIDSTPSVLDMDVGGMSLLDIIILVSIVLLFVLVILALTIAMKHKKANSTEKTSTSEQLKSSDSHPASAEKTPEPDKKID